MGLHFVGLLKHAFSLLFMFGVLFRLFQPREKGRMRFHKLQNVQIALDFLKHRQVSEEKRVPDNFSVNPAQRFRFPESYLVAETTRKFPFDQFFFL